jgi:hypothetical protein
MGRIWVTGFGMPLVLFGPAYLLLPCPRYASMRLCVDLARSTVGVISPGIHAFMIPALGEFMKPKMLKMGAL